MAPRWRKKAGRVVPKASGLDVYAVEIAADSPAAHYLGKYVTVDGIKFPTERRVYVAGPDGKPMPDLMTVSVDLSNYRFV